jgi:O-antigen/teichoic acid export membrane protein
MAALWLAGAFIVKQNDGYSQMAIFTASFSLMQVVLFVPNIANNVGMSVINHSANNPATYRRTFWTNVCITAAVVLLAVAAAAIAGPTLLRVFGRDFKEGQDVFKVLLLAAIPQGLALAFYQAIPSQSRMWLSFGAVALPRDALIVGLASWLAVKYGAKGVATAYGIAWTFASLVIVLIVYRIGLQKPPRTVAPRRGS